MKLIESLPHFLQEIREYKEILNTDEVEINKLKEQINKLLQEVIVQTANKYGLDRYEKIYNIKEIATTIEARRTNILLKMNNRTPFTLKWLDNKLKQLVGEGNYTIELDNDKYKLTIRLIYVYNDLINLLEKELRSQLPANLEISIYTDASVSIKNNMKFVNCVTNYEVISIING